MKTIALALCIAYGIATPALSNAQTRASVASGVGQAMSDIADQNAKQRQQAELLQKQYDQQNELLQKQHDFEMDQMREQYRLKAEAREEARLQRIQIVKANQAEVEQVYPGWQNDIADKKFDEWARLQTRFPYAGIAGYGLPLLAATNPGTVIEVMTAYSLHQQEIAIGFAKLERTYPDWRNVVRSKSFLDWETKQPQSVRNFAESERYDDVILTLDLYTSSKLKHKPKPPHCNPAAVPTDQFGMPDFISIAQQCTKKLASSTASKRVSDTAAK